MNLPRHAELWLAPYLKDRLRRSARRTKPKRAWVSITDHYEPLGMGASLETALGRVARWRDNGRGFPMTHPATLRASGRNTLSSTRRKNTGAICSTASLKSSPSASATWKCICITMTSAATPSFPKSPSSAAVSPTTTACFASRMDEPSLALFMATGRSITRTPMANGAVSMAKLPCCAISAATRTSPCRLFPPRHRAAS